MVVSRLVEATVPDRRQWHELRSESKGIDWPREFDPQLHDFYARKLLEPGWAGEMNHAEATYIARCLVANPRLRQTWQIARFTRRRKSITAAIVNKLGRWDTVRL